MNEITQVSVSAPNRFSFKADGGDFFILLLKNAFFTICSFGIYWFWAKVDLTKFLYNATRFQGFSFDYHATGKEKFIGFLKAFGILLVAGTVQLIITLIFQKIFGEEVGSTIGGLFVYIILFAVLPFIIIGSLRFRLSRTSFNGIRFQFLGDPKEFTILFAKSLGLTLITFGMYTPWALVAITTYIAQNSLFGNHAFDLRVKTDDLFWIYLKGIALSFFTFGIYSFWLKANVHNFFWNSYYFQNGKTVSDLTGGKLCVTFFKSVGFFIISFGWALPWIILINKRVLVESLSFSSTVDFDSISNIPIKQGSATIENIGGDALDSFGSIAG